MRLCLAALASDLLLFVAASAFAEDGALWRYVAPEPGEAMEHAPFLSLSLSTDKPEGLTEAVSYRGKRQLYTQLRYGALDSTRVAVVIDELGPGAFDLYLDRNRNRVIDADELAAGTGAVRRAPLSAEIVRGTSTAHYPRQIILRRNTTGASLGVATIGYVEGEADLDGRRTKVRRVDGNANGEEKGTRTFRWRRSPGTYKVSGPKGTKLSAIRFADDR